MIAHADVCSSTSNPEYFSGVIDHSLSVNQIRGRNTYVCDNRSNGAGNNKSMTERSIRKNTTNPITSKFQVYPLPFGNTLNIAYDFDYTSDVRIEFYNLAGQLLRVSGDTNVSSGSVTSLDLDFAVSPTQVYVIRVITDRETFFKKVLSGK